VLGPLKFIAYTENGVDTIKQHNVNVHLYAADTQVYACCHPHNTVDTRQRISHCTADFSRIVCISSTAAERWQDRSDLQHHDVTVTVGSRYRDDSTSRCRSKPCVWIDHELSMKQHVIKVAGTCFHQLRHLRKIRRRVGREVTTRLVLALVICRLDYCNSVLAGLPVSAGNTLQRVQNAAARLICQLKPRKHVTPSLQQQLHALVASETTSAV